MRIEKTDDYGGIFPENVELSASLTHGFGLGPQKVANNN